MQRIFQFAKSDRRWSSIGLYALIVSIVMSVILTLLDGVIRGPVAYTMQGFPTVAMLSAWAIDFRYLFEQGIYAATVLFVGAKFFETQTIMTIGFDKIDNAKIILKGPDDENIVWIGHKYGSKLEAEAISEALSERLKASAAA